MNVLKPHPEAEKRFKLFLDDVLESRQDKIHSVHMTGSALTDDYDPRHSDINSVCVLKDMDLKFLESLAPLGKKYRKKKVAAPLIMTPAYVAQSLDVFPIEFLNIRMLHYTFWGEDIFKEIHIDPAHLRHQCERELKVKLIGLRQGYISASGDRKMLTDAFISSFAGYIPLFRGFIVMLGKDAPLNSDDVLSALQDVAHTDMAPFRAVLKEKQERAKLSMAQLNTLFEDCYTAIEKLGDMADEVEA